MSLEPHPQMRLFPCCPVECLAAPTRPLLTPPSHALRLYEGAISAKREKVEKGRGRQDIANIACQSRPRMMQGLGNQGPHNCLGRLPPIGSQLGRVGLQYQISETARTGEGGAPQLYLRRQPPRQRVSQNSTTHVSLYYTVYVNKGQVILDTATVLPSCELRLRVRCLRRFRFRFRYQVAGYVLL
jgi:hypothetical protein